MLCPKEGRFEDVKFRKWIASLPCCVTGIWGETQCAHIRTGTDCGIAKKPSDWWSVPLSWREHAKQHGTSETIYWSRYGGIDRVKKLAQALYEVRYDDDAALRLLEDFKSGFRR